VKRNNCKLPEKILTVFKKSHNGSLEDHLCFKRIKTVFVSGISFLKKQELISLKFY